MKQLFILFSICAFAFTLSFCSESKKEEKHEPQKVSELAQLMRTMYDDGEQMKAAIEKGELPPDFREKFKKMHTAIPTEPLSNKPAFDAFANQYLAIIDSVYSAPNAEIRKKNYNAMVTQCVSCHEVYCPGPIKRIKKLTLN